MTDTDIDELEASRALDTDPRGLAPPPAFVGTPPESIDGAPPYMRTFFQKMDKTHKNTERMVADMQMMKRQFASFRDESRTRLRSLEEQVTDLEEQANSCAGSRDRFAEELQDLWLQFDDLKRRIEPYLDGK